MPPQIALILCIVFILYLFKMDSKRKSHVSRALWIPTVWMMIIGSRLISQWLNLGAVLSAQETYMDGNPVDRTVFSVLIAIGLFTLSKREIYWSQVLKSNAWFFLLFLYFGISILWSDFPSVIFRKWIKAIGYPIMVLVVLTDPDPVEAVRKLFKRCAYVLIPLSILFIKFYPCIGRSYQPWSGEVSYSGVTLNKNLLGVSCLVYGTFFLWNLITMWRNKDISVDRKEVFINILFLSMISWLLIEANSATSFMALIIASCILIGLAILKENVKYIRVYIFSVVSIFVIFQLSFDIVPILISTLGRDITLTGRVDLWKDLTDMVINPLIGTGFESFWLGDRLTRIWANYWWRPNQAHNGYLEIYLNLGLIGLSLLIGVIVSAYRKISKKLRFDSDSERLQLAFLAIVLIYNVTEATFKGIGLLWFTFILNAMDVPRISPWVAPEGATQGDDSTMDNTKNS